MKPVTINRDPRARFQRVAERRTIKVLKALSVLSRVTHRQHYTYTPEEGERICDAIDAAGARLRAMFSGITPIEFSLKDDGNDE